MHRTQISLLLSLLTGTLAPSALALDSSVDAIGGGISRTLLGDGTGVIVGVIDSGVDDSHPAFAGNDSQGNPRLVAEGNFVPTEPGNTGDDVVGHGTWVASAALGQDDQFAGVATDARFVNARVLDRFNGFGSGSWVENGLGFAIDQGADVVNLSLNFNSPNSSGTNGLDMMIDWAASVGVHAAVCVGNISTGNGSQEVRSPGSAFNGVTVGRTDGNFDQVHSDSATAFTSALPLGSRMKPDVVAPGTSLTLANDDWELSGQPLFDNFLSGCSFATPHVAGLMAQQIDAGRTRGLDTDPLVVKATMMNSANHGILDKAGDPWAPASQQQDGDLLTVTQSLNTDMGTGQVDGLTLSRQYLIGEQSPGDVLGIGWDLNSVDVGETIDYVIDETIEAGELLTTTITWLRHIDRIDDGDGMVNSADFFTTFDFDLELDRTLSDLDLEILLDGDKIAESISEVDNVEHLQIVAPEDGEYTIRVRGVTADAAETFSVAWFASGSNPYLGGDFNLSGQVDGDDFLIWQAMFGTVSGATFADGDADLDGDVDGDDFLAWQSNFGDSATRANAIPEPASAATLLLSAILLVCFAPAKQNAVRLLSV